MSQKVRLTRVSIRGAAPYLGDRTRPDGTREARYSRDGAEVASWLADGWRSRFNQLRSRRHRYDADGGLVPLGSTVCDLSQTESRAACSWLAAVPDLILHSTIRAEEREWFAATRRRTTNTRRGRKPGRMPRFRSRTRSDRTFTCLHNHGRNARYEQVNRNRGIITITGQNPPGHRQPGEGARFAIRLHVRASEPIRPYTSITVNLTRGEVVLTSPPPPIPHTPTGRAVGIDRGVVHAIATSDNRFFDLPAGRLKRIDGEIRRRQKAQARAVKTSGCASQRDYRRGTPSRRFRAHDARIRQLHATAARIVRDHHENWARQLVDGHDLIATERLALDHLTRAPAPVPDPVRPGRHLPNGRAAKRGLNRLLHTAALGQLQRILADKAARAGVALVEVDPRYTSQQCHQCGRTARENRKSQAVFHCTGCGHTSSADTNAARNILTRGLAAVGAAIPQGGARPGVEGSSDTPRGHDRASAVPAKREPLTAR